MLSVWAPSLLSFCGLTIMAGALVHGLMNRPSTKLRRNLKAIGIALCGAVVVGLSDFADMKDPPLAGKLLIVALLLGATFAAARGAGLILENRRRGNP